MTHILSATGILPLCCFPPVHWFVLQLDSSTEVDLEEDYPKQTFRNRYEILGANGRMRLTVPVSGQNGIKTPFREIQIHGNSWQKSHLASIRSAYGRSPYFEYVEDQLQNLFSKKWKFLVDFNLGALEILLPFTDLSVPRFTAFSPTAACPADYRNRFEPCSQWPDLPEYPQVFSDRFKFQSNLSILDATLNLGPRTSIYLRKSRAT